MAAVLVLLNTAAWSGGRAAFAAAEERRQVRETIDTEVAQIEAIIEEIRANQDLSEEQKEELIAPLEQAVSDLNEAQTLEEAYSALEEAEEKLQALEDPDGQARAEALQQAGQPGEGDPTDPLDAFRDSLAEGDLEAAAEDLREVDAGAMEQAERERLAQELEDIADALQSIDPDLAEQLREAAQAAREGDPQAAEEALENAAQAIEQIAENAQVAQAAGDAADGVGDAQENIVAAGQDPGEESGPGGTPVAGSGDGADGEGQGQGEGAGSGDGPGEGSGSGSGSGEGDQSGGEGAGSDPVGQGAVPDGGGSEFQPITPSSIGGEGSDWVAVPSSGETGDNVTGVGPTAPGDTGPITVPYTDVLPEYQAAVNEAIDSGFVPPQYRDIIRDYFSSLEP